VNLVTTFFREKLEGMPTFREYMLSMQSGEERSGGGSKLTS